MVGLDTMRDISRLLAVNMAFDIRLDYVYITYLPATLLVTATHTSDKVRAPTD